MTQYDVVWVRGQFPALQRVVGDQPAAYLDAPGGTQTPSCVVDAVRAYLVEHNSNIHGAFVTSEETDAVIAHARDAMADFLGCAADEVAFGANMTTLCFLLAQALGRDLGPGDEILVTELDHEANRGPWLDLTERGVLVREVPVHTSTCTLDWDRLSAMVHAGRTRVIAMGYASNAVGTVNDVAAMAALARDAGALSVVDAVHYALHAPIDVRRIGCDVLFCSAYKFFGPHVGVMYVRREVAERVKSVRLRTQEGEPPCMFETGTLNHEGLAGATAAVDFVAGLGRRHDALVAADVPDGLHGRRRDVVAGMLAAELYEQPLARRLVDGLADIRGVDVYGPPAGHPRTPTVAFTVDGFNALEVCRTLGERALFLWDGDFYAARLVERLGLAERGGLVRAGIAPYTTESEVDRLVSAVADLARSVR